MENRTSPAMRGLTDAEAYSRLLHHGRNESPEPSLCSRITQRLKPLLKNPLILLLLVLGGIAYLAGDQETAWVIWFMMAMAIAIQLLQEIRAQQSLQALTRSFKTSCTVLRGAEGDTSTIVSSVDLVPGDVVCVGVGDLVAADCLCVESLGLRVNQASLTGESAPVKKLGAREGVFEEDPRMPTVVLTGSIVMSGSGRLRVCRTGAESHIGKTLKGLRATEDVSDPNVHRFTMIMIRFILVMAPLVLVIQIVQHGVALEPFMYAVSVSVGLAPEMLPMIICACLVSATTSIERVCLVRRLNAIHSLATMTVLCTDKTGTLTKDEMEVESAVDAEGQHSSLVLALARMNSFFLSNHGNAIEQALQRGVEVRQVATDLDKVEEEAFSFDSRYASTVLRINRIKEESPEMSVLRCVLKDRLKTYRVMVICKGASTEVVQLCSHVRVGETVVSISTPGGEVIPQVRDVMRAHEQRGVRLLAIAIKCDEELERAAGSTRYQCTKGGLTLIGFVTFADQPKPSAKTAIQSLGSLGISVRMLTGDAKNVASAVAEKVGIRNPSFVLMGSDLDKMNAEHDPSEVYQRIQGYHVFAALNPRLVLVSPSSITSITICFQVTSSFL